MATTLRALFCCICLLLSLAPSSEAFPSGDGWEWMSDVAQMNGTQFMDVAAPLLQMCANAYRYPGTLTSIAGWNLSSQVDPLNPAEGGAHALVFEEHVSCENLAGFHHAHNVIAGEQVLHIADEHLSVKSSPHAAVTGGLYGHDSVNTNCGVSAHRIVIAFRGTQLSATTDSLADSCADKLLWDGYDFDSLPAECSIFNFSTLDYFSQAVNYTQQVMEVYPSVPLLLTGHSLGAGLAILVAAALSSAGRTLPVIGFSSPGSRKALVDRGISIDSLGIGNVIIIGHEWDAIMRSQMDGQVGLLCFYPQTEPSVCETCFNKTASLRIVGSINSPAHSSADEEGDASNSSVCSWLLSADNCMDCFYATHILRVLIKLVYQGVRPECEQAGGSLARSNYSS